MYNTYVKKYTLQVTKRAVFGKKLKKLRKEGILPGNIYGKDLASTAVQLPLKEFENVYQQAGSSSVVEVEFDGQKRPTLIHNLQYDYVSHMPLHADFFQVNLKEKVTTTVPVELVGEPKAVTDKVGLLLQTLNEVEVEALPADLPEHVVIDVTHLTEVGQQVKVSDIKKLPGVAIVTDAEQVVGSIGELVTQEAEEQAAQEEVAAQVAAGEETGAEDETPSTEEKPTETSQEEPKKE